MVLTAAIGVTSIFPVAYTKNQVLRLPPNAYLVNAKNHKLSVTCSGKLPVNLMVSMNNTKDKIWQSIPISVKSFPWKEAENVAVKKFLILGRETLKWSMLALYALSFASDIIYSISRNKELVIPFGLFIGCATASYLTEISQELINVCGYGHSPPVMQFASISCVLAVVKIVAVYIFRGNDLLLHISNGGLMQVLWSWRKILKSEGQASALE